MTHLNRISQPRFLVVSFLILFVVLFSQFGDSAFAQSFPLKDPNPRPTHRPPDRFDPPLVGNPEKEYGRAADKMEVRSETHIGCRIKNSSYASEKTKKCINDGPSPEYQVMLNQFVKMPADSKGFVDIPRAASKFVADEDDTFVAVTFSAMSFTSSTDEDEALEIRVLVDGVVAEPGEIEFVGGASPVLTSPSQSFTFYTTVDKGIHTVQVQYSTENIALNSSYLRNASVKVSTDADGIGSKKLFITDAAVWTQITGAEFDFVMPPDAEAAITFSSSLKMEQGDFIMLRAVVDNGAFVLEPKEVTLAGRKYHTEANSVTFNAEELPPGAHTVKFEWRSSLTDEIAIAEMTAWSIIVQTRVNDSKDTFFDVVSQNDIAGTIESYFQEIPNLASHVEVDEISDIAVTFSGVLYGPGVIIVAPMIDGYVETDQEVVLHHPYITFENDDFKNPISNNTGIASYTFALKELWPKKAGYDIGVAFRVVQSGVSTDPAGYVTDATLTVDKKLRVGPDLAVGPNMGRAAKKYESILEPIYGDRDVLTIIIDPLIMEDPAGTLFYVEIDDALNGNYMSAKDYFRVNSGGRLTLNKAATLGIYEAEHAGEITNDDNYYLDSENFDCESGAEYKGGSDALHAEALLQAEDDFDFAAYDKNNDGKLVPSELAIVVVLPRDTNGGSSIKTSFNPYCDDTDFEVDGIKIKETVHLNTHFNPFGLSVDEKIDNMMVAAHELSHHILGLDDIYGRYKGVHDGVNFNPLLPFENDCPDELGPGEDCQNRYVNTAPHKISLMTYKTGQDVATTHLMGFHKLHLGWVTPKILEEEDQYELYDVKLAEHVFILPRRFDTGLEYVLLETRYNSNDDMATLYDYAIIDSGISVYHVIEPDEGCKSPLGATDSSCKPLKAPMCVPDSIWFHKHASNFTRVGVRLIQPDMVHLWDDGAFPSGDDFTGFSNTMFGNGDNQLLDHSPVACPVNIADKMPDDSFPVPSLLWVDGKSSGYRIKNIVNTSPSHTFDLENDN